jgi:hypothetical protein
MPVQLSRVRRFTPEGVNKDRPNDEKIVVKLRTVDVYTKQLHIRKFLGKTAQELTKDMMSAEGGKEIKEILQKCVVGFENLEFIPEEGEPRPATIQDVWDAGEIPLCLDIFSNILNSSQLQKDEEKNSESQSGSSPTQEAEQVH